MKDLLEKHSKCYEALAEKGLYNIDDINRALMIVARFIQEKELILFGGNAIDLALREHGDFIYPEHQLPDYDCYSSDSVNDAYELAKLFEKNGFTNINVIRGIHPQTMKIRINYHWVADIGYLAKENFKKIKTLECGGFIIRHPHDQYIDIHSALSYPFGGVPKEQIKHRWKKDISRYNKLFEFYPIKSENVKLTLKKYQFTVDNTNNYAFTGFIAYSCYLQELGKYCDISSFLKLQFKFVDNNKFSMELPNDVSYIELLTKTKIKGDDYEPMCDFLPKYTYSNNIRYYSTDFYQVSINKLSNIKICTFQHMLMFFLIQMLYGDKKHSDLYKFFYVKSLDMLGLSQEKVPNYSTSPFSISLTTFGNKNMSNAYLLRIANYSQKNNIKVPFVDDNLLIKLTNNLPMNYYMKNEPPVYNYDNILFMNRGVKVFS